MRVLVCGGRDYNDRETLFAKMDELYYAYDRRFSTLIDGGANGADALAHQWAGRAGLSTERYRADWKTHGRAAGPIRNKRMLDEGKPDLVVAFPGGRGTANMVAQARAAGVKVIEIGGARDEHKPTS